MRCSDPTEYPRPAWLGWATITKVRLWRACREFPVKCLHETSLWQRCASGYIRPPGLFRTQQWGYAVCRTLGASCPLSLRKPFALLSDTPPAQVSPSGRGSALTQILSQKDGDSGPLDPQRATWVLGNQQQRRSGNACIRQRFTEH